MGLSIPSSPKSSQSTVNSSLDNSMLSSYEKDTKIDQKLLSITFQWKKGGDSVLITGSFFKWKVNMPLIKNSKGFHEITLELPIGQHLYKYLVNDSWTYAEDMPNIKDPQGNTSNIIIVEEKKEENIDMKKDDNVDLLARLSLFERPVKCPSFYSKDFIIKKKLIDNENSAYANVIHSFIHPNINHLYSPNISANGLISKSSSSIRVREKVVTICYFKRICLPIIK